MKLSNLSVVFFATLAFAIEFKEPQPTDAFADAFSKLQGWTPRPTEKPVMRIDLHKRAATSSAGSFLGYFAPDNTCGYVDGRLGLMPIILARRFQNANV